MKRTKKQDAAARAVKVVPQSRKNTLVLNVPRSLTTQLGDTTLIKNGNKDTDGFFIHNPNLGKVMKKDDYIVQKRKSYLSHAVIKNNTVHATFDITIAELEALVKLAKKRKAYFQKEAKLKKNKHFSSGFLIHFNPELSLFFKK